MRIGRAGGAPLLALIGLLALHLVAPAQAAAPPSPWNGVNPFNCVVQDAKLGATVPHPEADPFCIHFDKTNQNITQGGIATFLLQEPARTAAAAPKCFYFQVDHWRSSVVQDDGSTELYEWIGHYFFDKATGDGGVWVTGFSLNGHTSDPSSLPGFPSGYGQYFGPGTGGVITHDAVQADPACAAKAKADPGIYAAYASRSRCVPRGGTVRTTAVGPVRLGEREGRIRAALGPPQDVERGWLSYCVTGGGRLWVGQSGDRSGNLGAGQAPALILLTSSRRFVLRGRRGRPVIAGATRRALLRAEPRARHLRRSDVWTAGSLVFVLAHGRVRALGTYDRRAIRGSGLLGYVRRAGL